MRDVVIPPPTMLHFSAPTWSWCDVRSDLMWFGRLYILNSLLIHTLTIQLKWGISLTAWIKFWCQNEWQMNFDLQSECAVLYIKTCRDLDVQSEVISLSSDVLLYLLVRHLSRHILRCGKTGSFALVKLSQTEPLKLQYECVSKFFWMFISKYLKFLILNHLRQ